MRSRRLRFLRVRLLYPGNFGALSIYLPDLPLQTAVQKHYLPPFFPNEGDQVSSLFSP